MFATRNDRGSVRRVLASAVRFGGSPLATRTEECFAEPPRHRTRSLENRCEVGADTTTGAGGPLMERGARGGGPRSGGTFPAPGGRGSRHRAGVGTRTGGAADRSPGGFATRAGRFPAGAGERGRASAAAADRTRGCATTSTRRIATAGTRSTGAATRGIGGRRAGSAAPRGAERPSEPAPARPLRGGRGSAAVRRPEQRDLLGVPGGELGGGRLEAIQPGKTFGTEIIVG
jgi:hypothetical protein